MPVTHDNIFKRLLVDYAIRGTPRVSWELRDDFIEPGPYTFQLQVNPDSGNPDLWEDVGTPVENTYYALDDTQRTFGKDLTAVYRVILTTGLTTHTSPLSQVMGLLTKRQWLLARAIIRKARQKARQLRVYPGVVLKRKNYGTVCVCVDPFTGGITNSDCPYCYGTGKTTGYWKAVENVMVDLEPETRYNRRDPAGQRGTVDDVRQGGQFIGLPPLAHNDIWVEAASDRRYKVHSVRTVSEMNRVPLIVYAQLHLLELTDAAYDVPLTGS